MPQVRVARTYSTEAPGRTCKLRLPPAQPLEQVRPGAEEAAALLLLLRLLLLLGGAPRSRQEQQPSPALRAAAEHHAQPRPGGRAVGAGARCRAVLASFARGQTESMYTGGVCFQNVWAGAPSWRRLAEERTAVGFSRKSDDEQAAGDEHAYGGR